MSEPFEGSAGAIAVAEHPLLHARAFVARWPRPLAELPSPEWLRDLLREGADLPLERDEELRVAIRELLRHGGYRPTGRGKPSSEYLVRAAGEGALASINAAVDACNAISLASGFPISVVDLELVRAPLSIRVGEPGERYVFNASGQVIEVEGLLCLHDQGGACANAVKDSQRTKTRGETRATLSVLWGARSQAERTDAALASYRELHLRLGTETEVLL